jgi:hypothetical protein
VRFNIISNIGNGVGLQRDYELLSRLLIERGHQVVGVDFRSASAPSADVNIFIETLAPKLIRMAKANWIIPNSEWWYSQLWDGFLPVVNRVLCKTRDCLKIWERKTPGKAEFTGWEAEDIYRPEVERVDSFLHLAGKSNMKGTEAVIRAWVENDLPHNLTVVSNGNIQIQHRSIQYLPWLNRDKAIRLVNQNRFFVMCSEYEGYGQALYEAASCGSIVITTNAPPVNEMGGLVPECQVAPSSYGRVREAVTAIVDPGSVERAVRAAANLSPVEIRAYSARVRACFLESRQAFRSRLTAILEATHA